MARTGTKSVEIDRSRTPLFMVVGLLVGIGATAGAIFWGTSDVGQINVSATISNSQTSAQPNVPVTVSTDEQRSLPNGGLVPQGGDSVPAPGPETAPAPEATSTASTTESAEETDGAAETTEDSL